MYVPITDEFDALAYGVQHPGALAYAQEKIQIASQMVTESGRMFVDRAREMYERHMGHEAIRRAKAIVRAATHVFDQDVIRPLTTLGEIQNAKLQMQRWIMAEPGTRELYHQGRCDGYSGSYVDVFPGLVRAQHYDYRRVTQGLVMDDEDGGWHYTTYLDDVHEGDRELELHEQATIVNVWDIVRSIRERGQDDPTSKFGGML
jgi:hypothetical protein